MSAPEFAGRTAVVTAAAAGTGLATARLLVTGGARVAYLAPDPRDLPEPLIRVHTDFADDHSVRAGVAWAAELLGGIDLLVNVAGSGTRGGADRPADESPGAPEAAQGVWFNSRPKAGLSEERQFVRHVEIEGLPTGGWGYAFLPYVARYVRPLGLPTLSHTGRFHESWGDNAAPKPRAALHYECSQMLSLGLTRGVGDVLHPRGALSPAVYELIGSVYGHVERCEPFIDGGRVVSEVAVLVDPALGDNPGASGIGAVRALQHLRAQFDLLPPDSDLTGYRVVVVPESTPVDDALAVRLQQYRENGGAVLLIGPALLKNGTEPALPDLPVEGLAPAAVGESFLACEGVPGVPADFPVISYGSRLTARAAAGAEVLARVVAPYFPRSWDRFCGHSYTPPADLTDEVAVAVGGGVAAVTVPLLEAFHEHGLEAYRHLLGAALDRLLPDPLVRAGGPVHLETTVVRTPTGTTLNLISFVPARETPTLDLVHDPSRWSTSPSRCGWTVSRCPCGCNPRDGTCPGSTTAPTSTCG
ncbi:phage tail protein X [Kitasatospora sp. MAP12-15]|uniref:SDR family NAD(P)-dependent oxidoreductase n=1 Tax=unclassified Kitasatospora TaxID=2633591 RepID=UPI002473E6F4|nr:SDR family NAD(P)-dependent oxidoreductase [Kitasatospora sp. MAP12-44]MDH6115382.1 phage tail protein X [Kitasatospora sp. MAP12-44]